MRQSSGRNAAPRVAKLDLCVRLGQMSPHTHYLWPSGLGKLCCSHAVSRECWDGGFLSLHRLGVPPGRCPKMIGLSGCGAWVWSCSRSLPLQHCGHAGLWPRPTSPWPGRACRSFFSRLAPFYVAEPRWSAKAETFTSCNANASKIIQLLIDLLFLHDIIF